MKIKLLNSFFFLLVLSNVSWPCSAQCRPDNLLFSMAYYDEYMPYERLDKDIAMMKATGINVAGARQRPPGHYQLSA